MHNHVLRSAAFSTAASPNFRSHFKLFSNATVRLVCTLADAAGHDKPEHPESASRVITLRKAIEQQRLGKDSHITLQQPPQLVASDVDQLQQVLQLVHPASYLARLQEICSTLQAPAMIDDSTYIAPGSFNACCETAAAVLDVLDAVLLAEQQQNLQQQQQQQATMGFCMVRPPGHHVKASRPMGFGLINFIAVAAKSALQQPHINKVLILDWDVHHGNGTEDVFYDSGQVLYISTHQQGLWPYTGKLNATGSGVGQGYTINIPLPGDAGHDSMLSVWQRVIKPAARRFKPDTILCSAGYDAHWADPLAGLQFESRTYHMLCQKTAALALCLCQGRCVWLLEGGYHVPSLAAAVLDSLAAITAAGAASEACVGPAIAGVGGRAAHLREEPLHKVDALLDQVVKLHGLS